MIREIYYNINKRVFSIRAKKTPVSYTVAARVDLPKFVVREGGKQRNVEIVRTSPVKQGSSVRNTSSPFVHISAVCLTIKPGEHLGDHAQYQERFLRSGFMEH